MLACSGYGSVAVESASPEALPTRDVANATPQMSVAEVRRSLAFIRKSWEEQQGDPKRRPFYLSDTVAPLRSDRNISQSIEQFALNFVLAHHTRRLNSKPGSDAR